MDFKEQFDQIMKEFSDKLGAEMNSALEKGGEVLIKHLRQNSPVDESNTTRKHFKDCWAMKKQYNNVKYIGNTKITKRYGADKDKGYSENMPLSNILEFAPQNKPFIRRTFQQCEKEVYDKIRSELQRKL